ncbi:hypothetical protein [Chondromyces apiculatus]|uniref:Lipoprotein n=1 Tax=Chondromyces apiculatus DSM 436 TaxID=1192034 RepID=A0A017T2L9_9BACT|nr:hypothetical protein [Chondromyces apiculatus]EYF03504.1 Hypothetical protein CAP_5488 [Chondromyces apiculatus DSM 436]
MSRLASAVRHASLAFTAAVGLCASTACVGSNDDLGGADQVGSDESLVEGAGADSGGHTEGGGTGGPGTTFFGSDHEIAWLMDTFAAAELGHCQTAQNLVGGGEVLGFSGRMIHYYTGAAARYDALFTQIGVTPAGSAHCHEFMDDAELLFTGVGATSGSTYAHAYLDGQIALHLAMLDLIDTHMLPHVHDDMLRGEVTGMRWAMLRHRIDAEFIVCTMGGTSMEVCGQHAAASWAADPMAAEHYPGGYDGNGHGGNGYGGGYGGGGYDGGNGHGGNGHGCTP